MLTVETWLKSLGLEKYHEAFAANDVEMRSLPYLDGADLQELGVSLGHRKILLAAIARLRGDTPPEDGSPEPGPEPDAKPDPKPDRDLPTAPSQAGPAPPASEAGLDLRLLSVMFCDMVDSTRLSNRFAAEDLHDLITEYQQKVASAVKGFGGHVAKFLGDGVLVYFGWPMAYEDHAERAIRAGMAAVASVAETRTPSGEPICCRVGIATGRVVVGDLAGGGALDRGRVAGETPNLAARLQTVARPGEIVIGETTLRLARHAFETVALGKRELKGFEEPVPAFRVVGERDVESRFSALRGEALSHIVGRDSELGILLDKWELVKSGRGQAMFLTGEAGIGKSRLVEALLERLQGEPHELIRLQCSPYHMTSALYPVAQRLNRIAGFEADDDAAVRAQKLERLMALYGEDPDEVGALYSDFLSLDLDERFRSPDLSPQRRRELTFHALARRPFLAAERAPVLMVVEDAHWIDPSTDEFLHEVVSRIHATRVFVLISHRPEWSADWAAGQAHVGSVVVGRLARQQVREFVESMLGPVSERLVERIAERTDGVPLFVEELTRSIVESGGGDAETMDIPHSLQGSLMSRLDRLPPPCKEVAQIASVIGREFDRNLLARIVRLGEQELDDALRQLIAAQLVVMSGMSRDLLLFRHALITDTAYQSLLGRDRRRYHKAVADTIAADYPHLLATQPELVARHYTEARQSDLALPYWKKAGERALERSANYEAVNHFASALAIAEQLPDGAQRARETLPARLLLGEAQKESGRLAAAAVTFGRCADEARAAGDVRGFLTAALGFDASQFFLGVPLDKSVALLEEAMAGVEPDDARAKCLIMTRLARDNVLLGKPDIGERLNQQATEIARSLDDRGLLFELIVDRFLVPGPVLSPGAAGQRMKELDELMQVADSIRRDGAKERAHALNIHASAELGRRARVENSVAALDLLGEGHQRLLAQWLARSGTAMLAILDGDLAAAEEAASQGRKIGQQMQGEQVEGVYGIQMFSIRREQGRLAEVAPVLKRFLEENPEETSWLPGFALVATELGFEDAARRRLRELAEADFDIPHDARRSAALSYVAEVAARLDESDSAARLYELMSAYKHMTVTVGLVTVCYGAASRYLGMLAATLGELDKAEGHFEQALDMNASMRARPWLAHAKADYALLLRRRGRADRLKQAELLADEAWSEAADLGLVRLQQRLQRHIC